MSKANETERILEAALTGQPQSADEGPIVAELVRSLRTERDLLGAPRGAEAQIVAAVAAVPVVNAPAPRAVRTKKTHLRRRLIVVTASLVLLIATGGVGLANNAVPGQALYGLDMALERLGIGAGGASERAAEVLELLNQGETGLALRHAAAAASLVPEIEADSEAATALEKVAERFAADDSPVPAGVEDLIATLANSIGSGDGESISEIARAIRATVEAGEPQGPPEGVPSGPPSSTPGPPVSIPAPLPPISED